MDKLGDFVSKLKYPALFVVIGALFAFFAGAQSLSGAGVTLVPFAPIARIGAAIAAVVFVGVGLFLVLRGDGPPAAGKPTREVLYDVFLAAPMAGTETAEEYAAFRALCLDILADLRTHCGIRTAYFVGEKLHTREEFESMDVAAELDFDAIRQSARFLMLYPRKLVSSVLSEAGFALAEGLPSVYLVRADGDLPYLLTMAGGLPHPRYPHVAVRKYATPEAISQMIANDGANFFPDPA
jgi:hypothetical protein